MTILDIILIGIALSMDAFAVTISDTFLYPDMGRGRRLLLPLFFGIFQGAMPLLGYFLGSLVAAFIERFAGIVTFVILGFIGGQMIVEACKRWRAQARGTDAPTVDAPAADALTADAPAASVPAAATAAGIGLMTLILQAVATSIDAFAVGVSFCAESVSIWLASPIIACTTFLCCLVALAIGRRFGTALGDKAQLAGGIVLVLIGIKALVF